MGRTIPSFRQAMWMEYREWKMFRNGLSKSERKSFDQMWDLTSLYNSAMSNCVHPDRIKPIFISMLFHHYQQLIILKIEITEVENKLKSNT
jgi:hypothetical protein